MSLGTVSILCESAVWSFLWLYSFVAKDNQNRFSVLFFPPLNLFCELPQAVRETSSAETAFGGWSRESICKVYRPTLELIFKIKTRKEKAVYFESLCCAYFLFVQIMHVLSATLSEHICKSITQKPLMYVNQSNVSFVSYSVFDFYYSGGF